MEKKYPSYRLKNDSWSNPHSAPDILTASATQKLRTGPSGMESGGEGRGREGGTKEGCQVIKTTKNKKRQRTCVECMTQLARSRAESMGIGKGREGEGRGPGKRYEGGMPGNKTTKKHKKKKKNTTPIESLR